MSRRCLLLLLAIPDLLVTSAYAQDENFFEQAKEVSDQVVDTSIDAVKHPWVYFDLDLGTASLKVEKETETDKSGTFFGTRVSAFLDFDYFSIEGGAGYFSISLEGDKGTVKQKAAVAGLMTEVGALWLVNQELRFGGKVRWIFGTETDFGPVEEAKSSNLLWIAEGYYQPRTFENIRFGLHYQQDLTIENRRLNAILFSVGYGFPIVPRKETTPAETTSPKPSSIEAPSPSTDGANNGTPIEANPSEDGTPPAASETENATP